MIGRVLLYTLLLIGGGQVAAGITVGVDRSSLARDESFTLIITATGGENPRNTDLSPLHKQFEVTGRRRRSSFSINNGNEERSEQLLITLRPKQSGNLSIPPLDVDGTLTEPIGLLVRESSDEFAPEDIFFVEMEADKDTVYVHEQLLVTVRAYRAVAINDIKATGWETTGVNREQLGAVHHYSRTIDGLTYQVSEWVFAMFPERDGPLRIPGIEFSGRQMSQSWGIFGFNSGGRLLKRRAGDLHIQVKPVPAIYPRAAWLPASSLEITDNWSESPDTIAIGDSVTRTITLKAQGLRGPQLPTIPEPELNGIKIYADQPSHESATGQQGLTALGINSSAWVITEAGDYRIPPVSVPWWDVSTDKLRYATLPARTIAVQPGPAPVSPTPESAPAKVTEFRTEPDPVIRQWQFATAAALLGWLLSLLFLLGRKPAVRRADKGEVTARKAEETAFGELIRACKQGRAGHCRQQLLNWLRLVPGQPPNPTIDHLKQLFDEASVELLNELERSLYANQPVQWRGNALATALKALRRGLVRQPKGKLKEALPALYRSR